MRRDGPARLGFKSSFCFLASGLPRALQVTIARDVQYFLQGQVGYNQVLVVLLGPASVGQMIAWLPWLNAGAMLTCLSQKTPSEMQVQRATAAAAVPATVVGADVCGEVGIR